MVKHYSSHQSNPEVAGYNIFGRLPASLYHRGVNSVGTHSRVPDAILQMYEFKTCGQIFSMTSFIHLRSEYAVKQH